MQGSVLGINSNAIGVNVQVYTTSNIMTSIQDRFYMDNVIRLVTTILTV